MANTLHSYAIRIEASFVERDELGDAPPVHDLMDVLEQALKGWGGNGQQDFEIELIEIDETQGEADEG